MKLAIMLLLLCATTTKITPTEEPKEVVTRVEAPPLIIPLPTGPVLDLDLLWWLRDRDPFFKRASVSLGGKVYRAPMR